MINNPMYKYRNYISSFLIVFFLLLYLEPSVAQDTVSNLQGVPKEFSALDTTWMLIAASLVFFMNAGFAMVESGFCSEGKYLNVLAKNLIVFCVSTLAFFCVGFRFMFGDGDNLAFGPIGFLFDTAFPSSSDFYPFPKGFNDLKEFWGSRSFTALFFFQLAFAGTTATIVSGAVAERIRFWAFILFSFILIAFIYPLTGYWVWNPNNAWLLNLLNFHDFAGSTVVHSVGGMAALMGAWLLKPRNGRFGYDVYTQDFSGEEKEFNPNNLGFATLGCFILWVGWFGFNGGSTRFLEYVPHIILTTMLAGSFGGVGVTLWSPMFTGKKLSLSALINGILGGLVSITASSAYVDAKSACIIGLFSAFIVLLGEQFLNLMKIDDPVGAVQVHLFCGFWGTIAVGIFAQDASIDFSGKDGWNWITQTIFQALGWIAVVGTVGILSLITWLVVGYLLDLFDRFSDGKNLFNDYSDLNMMSIIVASFSRARNGIRVSPESEDSGGDATITN